MASYRLLIKRSAVKDLEALPRKDRKRIVATIKSLSTTPSPTGCEKLSGQDLYRVRQGNYRVLYTVQDNDLNVLVIKVAHRRDVYR